MNPFGTRARADELAALLDGAVVSLAPGSYDAAALALVDRLRTTGTALSEATAPRPEFRTALRSRLLAVAAVQGIGVPVAEVPAAPQAVTWSVAKRGQRGQRGLGVAAGAMASVVAVTGVAVASQRSLPGDPFYGTKKATEALQLRFADGDVEKGTQHLEFAETRLREVRALALGREELDAQGPFAPVADSSSLLALGGSLTERVGEALTDMDAQTRTGSDLLEGAFRASGEVEPLRVIATFARRQARSIERVLPSLPADVRSRAQESLSLVTTVAQESELAIRLGTCGDECDPQGAGPTVPASPEPVPGTTPGSTAVPQPTTTPEPDCECAEPQPEPAPTPSPTSEPTPEPSSTPSPTPSPSSPSPQPSPSSITPTEVPNPLPVGPSTVPLPPVVLPTVLPTPVTSLLPLQAPQP